MGWHVRWSCEATSNQNETLDPPAPGAYTSPPAERGRRFAPHAGRLFWRDDEALDTGPRVS